MGKGRGKVGSRNREKEEVANLIETGGDYVQQKDYRAGVIISCRRRNCSFREGAGALGRVAARGLIVLLVHVAQPDTGGRRQFDGTRRQQSVEQIREQQRCTVETRNYDGRAGRFYN